IARGDEPFHDEQCFHCQQSAEKYLKALLEELGHTVPKTHNLVAVLRLVAPHHAALRSLRRGLDFLTRFSVTTRYSQNSATRRHAVSPLRWAGQVRRACRKELGLPASDSRRRGSP